MIIGYQSGKVLGTRGSSDTWAQVADLKMETTKAKRAILKLSKLSIKVLWLYCSLLILIQ